MSPLPSTGIDVDVRLELADGVPAGVAGVVLLDGAGVHGDRHDALVGADLAGPQVGEQAVVQADAELRRDRHAVRVGGGDGGADDRPQQRRPRRHRRAAALARDLGGRAAEVEVDVVDEPAPHTRSTARPIIAGSEP